MFDAVVKQFFNPDDDRLRPPIIIFNNNIIKIFNQHIDLTNNLLYYVALVFCANVCYENDMKETCTVSSLL